VKADQDIFDPASDLSPSLPLDLDEFGLKPLRLPAPEDLFDAIGEGHKRGSILVTSDRALDEWTDLFGNRCSLRPVCTAWRSRRTTW
jgi:hypothetical protein